MIETYVKWCCDLEHVTYQQQPIYNPSNTCDYTTTAYKGLKIVDKSTVKQMTIDDYVFGDIAI